VSSQLDKTDRSVSSKARVRLGICYVLCIPNDCSFVNLLYKLSTPIYRSKGTLPKFVVHRVVSIMRWT